MPTVQQYRSDLDELVRLANQDLAALWREVPDGVVARDLLQRILPELGVVYGPAAGALAADWYDELRLEKDIPGRFLARVVEPVLDHVDQSARWAVGPLFSETPDFGLALNNAEGELQKIIADTGRGSVIDSSLADPRAQGWQRSASGGCGFCRMIAARGAVYSESTVRFGSHPNCKCTAVPAFQGEPLPVSEYQPSATQATPADRARTRQWMAENGY